MPLIHATKIIAIKKKSSRNLDESLNLAYFCISWAAANWEEKFKSDLRLHEEICLTVITRAFLDFEMNDMAAVQSVSRKSIT